MALGSLTCLEDVLKLERVEKALGDGDLRAASKEAKVYEMKPVAAALEAERAAE